MLGLTTVDGNQAGTRSNLARREVADNLEALVENIQFTQDRLLTRRIDPNHRPRRLVA